MLTQQRLKEVIEYNPKTGIFKRRYSTQKYSIGSEIGWTDRHGHRYVMVDEKDYRASRLAALYMTGTLPPKALNHIDRNNSNDAWNNLTAKRLPLNHAYLKNIVNYDPETGIFTWKVRRKGVMSGAGTKAGSVNAIGYVVISIDRKSYLAHRLAWFYMTGSWPEKEIDHKDRNRSNNKWSNLREATRAQNSQNSPCKDKNNKLKGAFYDKRDGSYFSHIGVNGKLKYLGRISTEEEAHKAYKKAAIKYHGEYASVS